MDETNTQVPDETKQEGTQTTEKTANPADSKQEAKYTDEQVNDIVAKKFAELKTELEESQRKEAEAVKEAARLAQMNDDERKEAENNKLLEELEELRKRDAYHSLSKEASAMLTKQGVVASDEVLAVVVKETAEDTKSAVEAFMGVLNTAVEAKVKEELQGETPKASSKEEKLDPIDEKIAKYTE